MNNEPIHQTPTLPQNNTSNDLSTVNVAIGDGMLTTSNHVQRPELPTPVVSFQNVQEHVDPALHNGPYQDEGFEDFRDFVNFIDGVGLSAQWTPEYDIDWMRLENYQESRRPSREPDPPRSPGNEDIGTPFSTWLPSAPAEDQINLRSHGGEGTSQEVGMLWCQSVLHLTLLVFF